jgi:hypothetical protein
MDPNEPRAVADETLDRYMERTSNAHAAALDDPLYAAQLRWMRTALSLADQAMEHEGIPEDTRRRVASAVVFGSFDEDEAVQRIEDHAARVRQMEQMPSRLVLDGACERIRDFGRNTGDPQTARAYERVARGER